MIELIQWFFAILIVSLLCGILYRKTYDYTLFRIILSILGFIGVFFHEIAHFIILNLFGVRTKGFSVHYFGYEGKANPNGRVGFEEGSYMKLSLLQAFMGSIAPVFFSTFLFMFCLDVIYNLIVPIEITVMAYIIAISLLMGSAPSSADIYQIRRGFQLDLHYSFYQLLLALLSLLTVFFLVDSSILSLPYEVLYYITDFIAIIFAYFVYKYSFLGIKTLISGIIRSVQKENGLKRKVVKLTRKKRFKPKKPPKSERKGW